MSNLKQIVKSSLNGRNVSPQVLENTEVYIQRAIWSLLRKDMLPARTWEFTSIDRKQEKRDGDDLLYNFY